MQGAYGAWVWTAPAGTYITGGSTFTRLATEDGQHGYLAVSPDAGGGVSYENQNDDQGHESGIPAGNWRFLVARLECTPPNEGNRCVGAAGGAHTYVKQVRIQLTDVVVADHLDRRLDVLGRGTARTADDSKSRAADQGAGLQSVQVVVNGQRADGDDLSGSCNPLPGNMTSRLAPCPPSFAKTYTSTPRRRLSGGPQHGLGLRLRLRAERGPPTAPASPTKCSSTTSAPARRSAAATRSPPASPATARVSAPSPSVAAP